MAVRVILGGRREMKKRLLALVLCCVMGLATFTGCGEEEVEEAAVQVEETATEVAAAADEMCSDESFAALQEAYAALAQAYDAVGTYYVENEAIEQSDDIEEALNSAKEYLDLVGEIQQNEMTEADAEVVAESMLQVAEGLEEFANAIVTE